MKNWLTIGQLATQVSLSQKALRVYEQAGLISAHARGENNYRYYTTDQIETVENIKLFKSFGFSLAEIRSLLEIDATFNSEKLCLFLEKKLTQLQAQKSEVESAQVKIQKIVSSLQKTKPGIDPDERRFIMNQLEKVSVVVTGVSGLEKTAEYITKHLTKSGKNIPVTIWDGESPFPLKKPYVLVISEEQLKTKDVSKLSPDIVVVKEAGNSSAEVLESYFQLYGEVGPHMTTILNADDRAVVKLAGSDIIRKGRTYYFSKNSGLQSQICQIGGVISDGEKIEIYGLGRSLAPVEIKIGKILGHGEEMSYMASLAAVMDLGLNAESLHSVQEDKS